MRKIAILIVMIVGMILLINTSALSVPFTKQEIKGDYIFYDYEGENGDFDGGIISTRELDETFKVNPESKPQMLNTDYPEGICTPVAVSGDPKDKLDIIFVATHFYPEVGDGSKFASDVNKFKQAFYEFGYFSEKMNKINIWRVDFIDMYDGCNADGYCPWDDSKNRIKTLASQCKGYDFDNNDQIIIMFDGDNTNGGSARADLRWDMVYLFSYKSKNTLIHELGHSFGKLGDEYDYYTEQPTDTPEYPNCASLVPGYTCEDKWGDLIGEEGVGCVTNCHATNWFRPTVAGSIMRSSLIDHFCPVSTRVLDGLMSIYTEDKASCLIMSDLLTKSFSSQRGDENYNKIVDFNKDGKINLADYAIFGINFENEDWCSKELNPIIKSNNKKEIKIK